MGQKLRGGIERYNHKKQQQISFFSPSWFILERTSVEAAKSCAPCPDGLWPTNYFCQSSSSWSLGFWELWFTWSSSVNRTLSIQHGCTQEARGTSLSVFSPLSASCPLYPDRILIQEQSRDFMLLACGLLLFSRELLLRSSKRRRWFFARMVCNYMQWKGCDLPPYGPSLKSVITDWGLFFSGCLLRSWPPQRAEPRGWVQCYMHRDTWGAPGGLVRRRTGEEPLSHECGFAPCVVFKKRTPPFSLFLFCGCPWNMGQLYILTRDWK